MTDTLKKSAKNGYKQLAIYNKFKGKMEYTDGFISEDDYCQMEIWKEIKKDIHKRDDYKCQRCGSPFNLVVHHFRYPDAWGLEEKDDLITFCDTCHKEIHEKDNSHD